MEGQQLVIGMLGGMSWESTAEYYRLVNEGVRDRLGGLHSARVVIISLDFAEVERLQAEGRWTEAGEILADAARRAQSAGADFLLLCTNTMHKVAAAIEGPVAIPLLHIADVAARAVRAAGLSCVALLGTGFTMEQDFYRARLGAHGLTVMVPGPDERVEVHRVIYEELCLGLVREESRARLAAIIGALAAQGAQGAVLGCTELELLVRQEDSPVPVFPTTRLHVAAAVERALAPAALRPRSPAPGA
jgi:amino-acid racemase